MSDLDTDYLVIGAGAAGLAFVDSLVSSSDHDVVMVERREAPGGHWNDAYPFVRLHSPSACYGVNSLPLGDDTIDRTGPNAGLYERATGAEVRDYFHRVLDEQLVASGQVRFFGGSDYLGGGGGEHRFSSLRSGEETTVRVRRKLVDATRFETPVPATHTPSFGVDPEARLVPVNDLIELDDTVTGYTIIGAGKTANDACIWLLENGIDPSMIRWVKPRDAWHLDRASLQPLELLPELFEGQVLQLEAAAEAESCAELFDRLEADGQLHRIDPEVEPTMYRCAMVSAYEMEQLRRVDGVVRLGRVRHIGRDQIAMEDGTISTDPGQLHVDCSAIGLRSTGAHPVFEDDRIVLHQVRMCQPTFNAALIGFLEASERDDTDKDRLCPPNPYPRSPIDWLANTYTSNLAQTLWGEETDLSAWSEAARLNLAGGLHRHLDDPRVPPLLTRFTTKLEPALANLQRLMAEPARVAAG